MEGSAAPWTVAVQPGNGGRQQAPCRVVGGDGPIIVGGQLSPHKGEAEKAREGSPAPSAVVGCEADFEGGMPSNARVGP